MNVEAEDAGAVEPSEGLNVEVEDVSAVEPPPLQGSNVENAEVEPPRSEGLCNRIRQMTTAERFYFIATCVLSLVMAVLVAIIIVFSLFSTGGAPYCVSKECIRSAQQIIGSMNSSVDPCTDFYKFACGGLKKVGVDEDDNWSNRMLKEFRGKAAELLGNFYAATDYEAVRKARGIFDSCMATNILDNWGLEPLFELLDEAGLPRGIPNSETVADFDLSRTLARVQRTLGKAVLLNVLRKDNETFMVTTEPFDIIDTLSFEPFGSVHELANWGDDNGTDFIYSGTILQDWQEFLNKFIELADDIMPLAGGFRDSEFDTKTKFLPPNMNRKRLSASAITNILYNGTVPKNKSNTLYYEVYMETLLKGRPGVNWNVNKGKLQLVDPEYHLFLVSHLQKNFTPVQIQMLIWTEVIKHFGVHTTSEIRKQLRSRRATMLSVPPRSEICANLLMDLMPVAVDHLLAQVHPLKKATEQVKAMAREIKISQRDLIQNATWLGPLGMKNILRYVDDVEIARVGYINWVKDGRRLDEFYKNLPSIEDIESTLLRTIADIQVWQAKTNLFVSPKIGRLRTDPIKERVNYVRSTNTITIRPMAMQFPFYPLGLEALNYGAMGLLLGHEFAHVLDAEAFATNSYFSLEDPAVKKVDGFFNCTKRRIQISTNLKPSSGLDLRVSEDTSDISGIKTALYTFNKIRKGPEPHLPGLENFSHDQLFFLALGNVWCHNGNPPGLNGPYYVYRNRMLNAVRNTPEFAKVWNCPAGTLMNPKDYCTLW